MWQQDAYVISFPPVEMTPARYFQSSEEQHAKLTKNSSSCVPAFELPSISRLFVADLLYAV